MIRPSLISKLADNGSAKENISPKRGGGLVHRSVLTLEHSEPGRRRLRDGILGLSTIPIEGAASMSQRPFSVIVVSWVYLAAGAFGMAFHLADLSLQAPFRYDTVWASLVPAPGDSCWNLYAPWQELGAVARPGLDGLPRGPERLSLVA